MSEQDHIPEGEPLRWLDHARNRTWIFRGVVATYVFFFLVGFLPYEHHPLLGYEAIPGFHALYGLGGCIGLVLGAAWLRTWLMRDEDYYDAP